MTPKEIIKRDDYTIAKGDGGCNFVIDLDKPHLGGHLENSIIDPLQSDYLFPFIMQKFNPKTMLDIGCAEGNDTKWFSDKGVKIVGIDGFRRSVDICSSKGLICVEHDYTKSALSFGDVDLIWCSDVLEHIEERYLDNIINTFRSGKTLIICHGLEGNAETGWHHVTNKTNEWWEDKITSYGFKYDKELSEYARNICGQGWFFLSGKIFYRL